LWGYSVEAVLLEEMPKVKTDIREAGRSSKMAGRIKAEG
jgi:hypothetical protein